MRAALRKRTLAFVFFGLATILAPSVASAVPLDTSKLPRSAGSREVFASPSSTIFTSPDNVLLTAEAVRRMLLAKGWQPYEPRAAAQAASADLQIASFKKEGLALSVFITLAPAQSNATSVSYSALRLKHDLPFPKDATEIVFDPDRPMLSLTTAAPLDQSLKFFRTELGKLGWQRWSSKDGVLTSGPDGEMTERGAYSYYKHDSGQPMILLLQNNDGGRLKVDFKPVPASMLTAETQKPEPKPAPQVAKTERSPVDDAIDAAIREAASGAIAQAMSGITRPAAKAIRVSQAEVMLRARSDAGDVIVVPEKADDVEADVTDGRLEFEIEASVKAVAAFYRDTLKGQGWKEKPSVINRPNMSVLQFSKGGKDISMTIMQMGATVNLTASGSGLIDQAAAAAAVANAPVEELTAEMNLPVPTKRSSSAMEKTPLRKQLTVTVDSTLKSVLAFYRRELSGLGWKEEAAGAVEKPEQVVLVFASPDGPAQLKLDARGTKTEVRLALRSRSGTAANRDMIPGAGQGKILFGNINDTEASIVINKKTVKIGAGVGAKGPGGPSMELPQGKYSFSYRIGSRAAQSDQVEIKAGETWGLMVGPGGVLAVQIN